MNRLISRATRRNPLTLSQRQCIVSRRTTSVIVPIKRFYQSEKSWEHPDQVGYFDTLAGVYEDPNFTVDLRPFEWREGQYLHYISEIGIMILCVPAIIVICLCFSMLAWYTFYDPQSSVLRDNPHPFLAVQNGQDLHNIRNPILMQLYPFGAHQDKKIHFYYEIEDAIERKKKLTEPVV
jgi:hypothetical protein